MRPLYGRFPYLILYRLWVAIMLAATVGMTAASLASPWLVRELVRLVCLGKVGAGGHHVARGELLILSGGALIGFRDSENPKTGGGRV